MRPIRLLAHIGVALVSFGAVAWGAIRAVAYGEQQPARGLIVFGAIALAASLAGLFEGRYTIGRDSSRDWRDYPVWVATASMLASALLIRWLGDGFWEDGYGPALSLATAGAIGWLCRRMTVDVFGALILVGWLIEGARWLLDVDGWPVVAVGVTTMIATGYLLGDRSHRSRPDEVQGAEPNEARGPSRQRLG